jgi:hypothetical protein
MKTSRTTLDQAIALQRSEVMRLQKVSQVDLPLAQKRLAKLEILRDKLTPTTEALVDDIIKEVVK